MLDFLEFRNTYERRGADYDHGEMWDAYQDYFHENVQAGDGVTIHYYTDAHAGTVISRTKNKLVIRRDKATLDPNWKPEFIPGGFCAHCTNQSEQTYTYEPNPDGVIYTARWNDNKKRKGWYVDQSLRVSFGRREFYDYNF